MTLTRRSVPQESSSDIVVELLEEKEYDARLVYVADLGIQEGMEWAGEKKPDCQQIAPAYEIIGETITIDGEEKPRLLWGNPFNIFSTLTDKGNELKVYGVFDSTAGDGDTPDWDAQLLKPCSVRVVHADGKGKNAGKVFDNVGAVIAIPEKYQGNVPPALTEPAIGDADDPNNVVTKGLFGLPKYVYDKRIGAVPKGPVNEAGLDDDDIPF